MTARLTALALGAALCWSGAAEAKTWSHWVKCDGYAKPQSAGVKAAKSLAALSTLGLFGIPESFNPEGREEGAAGVEACTAALNDPAAADGPWIRRVTLNQALAIHHLEAKDAGAALAAIDAAAAAAGSNASDAFYARSTGVSLALLRSVALYRLDRPEEAAAEAARAAEARPYSARVQMLSLGLMGLDPAVRTEEIALAERLARLDPSSAGTIANVYLRAGRYGDAWALLSRQVETDRATAKKGAFAILTGNGFSNALMASFAAARSGHVEEARRLLDEQVGALREAASQLAAMRLKAGATDEPIGDQLVKPIERWRVVVEAAALVSKGDMNGAQDALAAAAEVPMGEGVIALIADIQAQVPAADRKGIVQADVAELRARLEGDMTAARIEKVAGADLFALLPEPEDERRLNSFSKQAGWGLKPTGFKHRKLDGGLTRIEFVGSSSSALAVEEMTLLRAATLAREEGHRGFAIEGREDYLRYTQTTYNNVPIGKKTLAGYKTEILVRFLDDVSVPGGHDAGAIQSALAPIYVRTKTAAR